MTKGKSCGTVKLLTQNRQEDKPFVMKTVTQNILYRQALISYARQIRSNKSGNQVQNQPPIYLPLASKDTTEHRSPLRINPVVRTITQTSTPQEELEAHSRYAKEKRQCRIGSVLGETASERVYTVSNRSVPPITQTGRIGSKAAKSEIHPKAV